MYALACHSGTPCASVRAVEVRLRRREALLEIAYRLTGDLERLSIPDAGPVRRGERLWQHTCFEVFVAEPDMPAYREFNFSPSGEWAAYDFARYREAAPAGAPLAAPEVMTARRGELLALDARVPVAEGRIVLGLSAVVEDRDGGLSYWALRHPAGKPDFHHPDAFALELA